MKVVCQQCDKIFNTKPSMSKIKVCYISGAYRSNSINGIYENIYKARKLALEYWEKGYAVLCPHMNTAFMDGACHDDTWIQGDLEFVRRSDIMVMMGNWQNSEGAKREHDEAVTHGLQIIYE